jgi:hypothetical protein
MHHRPVGWIGSATAIVALVLTGSGCFESSTSSPETLRQVLADNNAPEHGRTLFFVVNHRKLPLSAFRDLGISTHSRTLVATAANERSVIVCAGGRAGSTLADSLQCGHGSPPGVERCTPRTTPGVRRTQAQILRLVCRYAIPAGVDVYRLRPQPDAPRSIGPDVRPVAVTPETTVLYLADPRVRIVVELGGAGFDYSTDARAVS